MGAMNPVAVAAAFAVLVLAGAYCGALARRWVPDGHQDANTLEVVKLGVGFLGTLAALVLGLVVASAKDSFDVKTKEVQSAAAKALQIDRRLQRLGSEALPVRMALRDLVASRVGRLTESYVSEVTTPMASSQGLVSFVDQLRAFEPKDEMQRQALTEALAGAVELEGITADAVAQAGSSITTPLLVLLVFWFGVVMAGWNFIARSNGTILFVNVLCALSISGAIYFVLQMDQPFEGLIRVSDAPLRAVLPRLAR
jgi:hypothetical protein